MPNILIVDDSVVDRKLAGSVLEKLENAHVDHASNGLAALEQIPILKPDLVVTDMQMPDMNGLQLVIELRHKQPRLPVVLMTAKGSEELAIQALEAGAAGYVPKRRLLQDLGPTVERVLANTYIERQQSRVTQRLTQQDSVFVVENDINLLLSLSSHLRDIVHTIWQCDPVQILRIGMAVEESLINACYHGNLELDSELRNEDDELYRRLARQRLHQPPYAQRRITVEVHCGPGVFRCSIRDEGPGFDPAAVPDPFSDDALERPSGRGLTLIRSFMDEVRFKEPGNTITMIKHATKKTPR